MNVLIVTPAPPKSLAGNRITARRWARVLRELGHRVAIVGQFDGQSCDVMIALHARRSASSIRRFKQEWPDRRLIVALTGTDLYHDLKSKPAARRSLDWAWRLVVLQAQGLDDLPVRWRKKTRVIYQSVADFEARTAPPKSVYEVCVMGHLRAVKDPFRAAMAARHLPAASQLRVVHLGAALSPAMRRRALAEMQRNPRYHWLGQLPRSQALQRLARSRLLVLSSKMEGGANVVSEALAAGVPVISSRISGSLGLLGPSYPGYFSVGDTLGLAHLLERAEMDHRFYESLRRACRGVKALIAPERERRGWRDLLNESVTRP